mmetsp:Transcript_96876/g.278770  ORF Transcript_96876/g.278770 Transcript_96876/m.278770 type:complete len:274 (+) Transcript_96876:98-919(+)
MTWRSETQDVWQEVSVAGPSMVAYWNVVCEEGPIPISEQSEVTEEILRLVLGAAFLAALAHRQDSETCILWAPGSFVAQECSWRADGKLSLAISGARRYGYERYGPLWPPARLTWKMDKFGGQDGDCTCLDTIAGMIGCSRVLQSKSGATGGFAYYLLLQGVVGMEFQAAADTWHLDITAARVGTMLLAHGIGRCLARTFQETEGRASSGSTVGRIVQGLKQNLSAAHDLVWDTSIPDSPHEGGSLRIAWVALDVIMSLIADGTIVSLELACG